MRVLNRRRTIMELNWCAIIYKDRKKYVKKDAHWVYQIGIKLPKKVRF